MVYIVAGATGVVGTAISKELASENDVIIIGRDEEKLSALSQEIDAEYSVIDLNNTVEQREFSKIVPEDRETYKRIPHKSAEWFGKISSSNILSNT